MRVSNPCVSIYIIHAWKEHYLKELAKRKHDEVLEVKELPPKKRGRPLLLGAELDARVQLYIKEMRKNGGAIWHVPYVYITSSL